VAKFVLEVGEATIGKYAVNLIEAAKRVSAELVITDRRLVVSVVPGGDRSIGVFGMLGGVFAGLLGGLADAARGERVAYTIRRDKMESVEAGERKLIVFHDSGEGYAHTSFAIESKESFSVWQERMHRWAAGESHVASLPSATLVKRD
jgi:hypothetical protein